ncbi:MAG: DMT family transporter [Bacteroidota bacterium]
MNHQNRFLPAAILTLLSLIWGTSFILIKQGLKSFSPDEVGALRVTAASFFLLPIALMRMKELRKGDVPKLLFAGLMGTFIPAFLFATAQTRISSSVTGIMNSLSPLFTVLMGSVFFGQKVKGYALGGILVAFAGSLVLMLSSSGWQLSGINSYALLIVLACAMYGFNLNFIKYRITGLNPLTLTAVAIALVGPLAAYYLFGVSDFTMKLQLIDGAWRSMGFIVLLGLMSTAIATVLFTYLVQVTSPLFASSVTYLMPVVSVMWGVIDHELLFIGHFAGMIMILGGVWIANRR